jgi:DNA-binding MarR family transcriptional regulator
MLGIFHMSLPVFRFNAIPVELDQRQSYALLERELFVFQRFGALFVKKNIRRGAVTVEGRQVLDLERHIPYFFTYISNRLSRGASQTYRKHFGVGITEWRVMGVIAGLPNISANQIINAIGLDKGAVSRSLDVLDKQGLTVSTPDPNDNRSRLIKLSRAGQTLHDRIIEAALEREERLLSTLTHEEVETLIICLRKMRAIVPFVNAFTPSRPKKSAAK